MFVGLVALRHQNRVDNEVPQLPQTQSESFDQPYIHYYITLLASPSQLCSSNLLYVVFIGPIASALVNTYSCRTVTMAGAVIGAIGFVISPFAPAMWFLYLSFGIVAGEHSLVFTNVFFFIFQVCNFFKQKCVQKQNIQLGCFYIEYVEIILSSKRIFQESPSL